MPLADSYWPADHGTAVLETTIGDVLRSAAAAAPDREALAEAQLDGAIGRRWTYAQLLAQAERLAAALASRYAPGERVCIWAPNCADWVLVEYAAALAGLVLVTANPAYQQRELKFVLEQSRSVGLLTTREHRGNPMAEIAAAVAAELTGLREVVDIGDADALFAVRGAPGRLPEVRAGDAAQILYTSGTTGFPKGAMLHHRGLTNNARMWLERAGAADGEAVLYFMPMFHAAGGGMITLGTPQVRGRMIVAPLFDAGRMLDLAQSERAGLMLGVPTMLVGMLEAQVAAPRDLSSLRMVVSGGSMVPPELVRRVRASFGCDFQIVYGQTESSPVLTQASPGDDWSDLCETVGRPLPAWDISIRDPATGAVRPLDAVGEICARGYGVMLGYNDNDAATRAAIDAEGWLHTGDLGTMDARGYVRVTGRVKEMIIRGGENLFPAEIENVLLEHPSVAEVAVVGAPDPRWGEIVVCFVRTATGAGFDPAALRAHCRKHLSAQKTPAHWVPVTEWPLTGSGKIQKFVLRDRFVAGEFA
ncbi:MAG TPA: AMP-binding protein [Caulobacteraceae bacterium]|nr:AMP-binding protein [Caulobacteraceae bacterium]